MKQPESMEEYMALSQADKMRLWRKDMKDRRNFERRNKSSAVLPASKEPAADAAIARAK